jgi:TrpR-related protein YerC/YecD
MSENVKLMKSKLYKALLSLKTEEDCKAFLADLCTDKEIEQMAQRIRAAELLFEGKSYNQISEELNISSATLARVSRAVQYGEGYKKFVEKPSGK